MNGKYSRFTCTRNGLLLHKSEFDIILPKCHNVKMEKNLNGEKRIIIEPTMSADGVTARRKIEHGE